MRFHLFERRASLSWRQSLIGFENIDILTRDVTLQSTFDAVSEDIGTCREMLRWCDAETWMGLVCTVTDVVLKCRLLPEPPLSLVRPH